MEDKVKTKITFCFSQKRENQVAFLKNEFIL